MGGFLVNEALPCGHCDSWFGATGRMRVAHSSGGCRVGPIVEDKQVGAVVQDDIDFAGGGAMLAGERSP